MIARLFAALAVFVSTCFFICGASAENDVCYKKGYVDGPYGQVHYHRAQPSSGSGDKTPVVFFHQNPNRRAARR